MSGYRLTADEKTRALASAQALRRELESHMPSEPVSYESNLLPRWAHELTAAVRHLTKEIQRMSADQAHLDQTVAADEAALTSLEQVITDLKNQPAAAAMDFTAADAFVARIQGDATPPAPAA